MDIAVRLRQALAAEPGITEKRMFGGICFLRRGNMLAGTARKGHVMFRVGKAAHQEALRRPGAKPMVHGGRNMEGFIWVEEAALQGEGLDPWLALAKAYNDTLPVKSGSSSKEKTRGKKSARRAPAE